MSIHIRSKMFEKAVEIVEKLDYDFELADKDAAMGSGVIARTIMLDKMVSDYLCKHENAIVVNIACGLDTRCYRNEDKYKKWYNIDLPDTINVRSRFMKEEGPVIYQFAESAMDETWAEKIEYNGEPVLVIIEGLTMYLTEEDVVTIFDIIDKKFKKATVLVEVMNPFIVKNIKEVNYIDIFSRMQLERLILECQPTMLFVEHDRKFCQNRHQGADNLVVEMSFSAQLVDVNNPEAGRKYLLNGYLKEVYAVCFLPDIPRICLTNN